MCVCVCVCVFCAFYLSVLYLVSKWDWGVGELCDVSDADTVLC